MAARQGRINYAKRKTRVQHATAADGGVGLLANCPYLYPAYECAACHKPALFGSKRPCLCYKKHHFRATAVLCNEIRFPSIREAARYSKLRFLEDKGIIKDLKRQIAFACIVNEEKICAYIADFSYVFEGRLCIEDSKGCETPEFKLKKKLVEALFSVKILLS